MLCDEARRVIARVLGLAGVEAPERCSVAAPGLDLLTHRRAAGASRSRAGALVLLHGRGVDESRPLPAARRAGPRGAADRCDAARLRSRSRPAGTTGTSSSASATRIARRSWRAIDLLSGIGWTRWLEDHGRAVGADRDRRLFPGRGDVVRARPRRRASLARRPARDERLHPERRGIRPRPRTAGAPGRDHPRDARPDHRRRFWPHRAPAARGLAACGRSTASRRSDTGWTRPSCPICARGSMPRSSYAS